MFSKGQGGGKAASRRPLEYGVSGQYYPLTSVTVDLALDKALRLCSYCNFLGVM